MNVAYVQTFPTSATDPRGFQGAGDDQQASDQFSQAMASAQDNDEATPQPSTPAPTATADAGPAIAPTTAAPTELFGLVVKAGGGTSTHSPPAGALAAGAAASGPAAPILSTQPIRQALAAIAAPSPDAPLPAAILAMSAGASTLATSNGKAGAHAAKADDSGATGSSAAVTAATPEPQSAVAPTAPDPIATMAAAAALAAIVPAAQAQSVMSAAPAGAASAKTPASGKATDRIEAQAATSADEDSSAKVRVVGDIKIENYLAPATPANVALAGSQTPKAPMQPAVAPTEASAGKALPAPDADPTPAKQGVVAEPDASGVLALDLPGGMIAPSITNKVAAAVITLAQSQPSEPSATATTQALPAARTMTLQLAPADLGTISVKLHVTGDALDVQLQASDSGTAALLGRDRDALAGALSDQNYHLNSLVIGSADGSASPGGNHDTRSDGGAATSGGAQSGNGGDGGTDSRDASGDSRRRGASQDASGRSVRSGGDSDANVPSSRNGGVLLV